MEQIAVLDKKIDKKLVNMTMPQPVKSRPGALSPAVKKGGLNYSGFSGMLDPARLVLFRLPAVSEAQQQVVIFAGRYGSTPWLSLWESWLPRKGQPERASMV